ncbi:hypothetical protein G6F31_020144 [Rhizopus arrhizus]|nr:hypothetical protein G6F31_020144 [Rhizopus arrhizus]
MPLPMASNVARRTQGGRVSSEWRWQDVQLVAGVDGEDSRHRGRMGMGRNTYRLAAWETDANFRRYGAFSELTLGAGTDPRWVTGLRIERASVRDERHAARNGWAAVSCATNRTWPMA